MAQRRRVGRRPRARLDVLEQAIELGEDASEKVVLRFIDAVDAAEPYNAWETGLRDRKARARIRALIGRLHLGNFGEKGHRAARGRALRRGTGAARGA